MRICHTFELRSSLEMNGGEPYEEIYGKYKDLNYLFTINSRGKVVVLKHYLHIHVHMSIQIKS